MTDARKSNLLVSVVIPAYNSRDTIARALDSALAQTYPHVEIIVVDDCSSDGTSDFVRDYSSFGVKLIQLAEQQGASGARNAGIGEARGDLIAFLDSDDEWLPTKLEKQVSLINKEDQYIFVSCASNLISETAEDLGDLYDRRRPVVGADCWKGLLARPTTQTSTILVWRQHLVELGGFDRHLKICEDQDLWIRLALRGSVGFFDESLVRVHSRADSLSRKRVGHQPRVVLDVIERHIASQRARLRPVEIRAIRGERLAWVGRTECDDNYFRGVPTLIRSMLLGYRPTNSAIFLASALPPARWLKTKLRSWFQPYMAGGANTIRPTTLRRPHGNPAVASNRARHPLLPHHPDAVVEFPKNAKPRLLIIIDAEEQYDWRLPLSRSNTSVQSMAAQERAQRIYRRFGIVPTYAVDYPVVMQEAGYQPLMEMLDAGECEIGAQLHPWVTPPFEEQVCERNSFAGNLPLDLERKKLQVLVEAIRGRFGSAPRLYRAGRYGTGEVTAAILEELGLEIDCSVVPGADWPSPYAPDYTGGTARPYWLQTRRPVLEIPVTVGSTGLVRHLNDDFYRWIRQGLPGRLRAPGIMARARLLNRVRLSPEGTTLAEAKLLTRRLIDDGYQVFAVSYHTPSLEPGNTPYVRDQRELERFLTWIERYLEFFFSDINGVAATPGNIYEWALASSSLPIAGTHGLTKERVTSASAM